MKESLKARIVKWKFLPVYVLLMLCFIYFFFSSFYSVCLYITHIFQFICFKDSQYFHTLNTSHFYPILHVHPSIVLKILWIHYIPVSIKWSILPNRFKWMVLLIIVNGWWGEPLYLLQMVPGTVADTLLETEETVPQDERICGKSTEGKRQFNFLICSFIHSWFI
jgi:hypothetical protein